MQSFAQKKSEHQKKTQRLCRAEVRTPIENAPNIQPEVENAPNVQPDDLPVCAICHEIIENESVKCRCGHVYHGQCMFEYLIATLGMMEREVTTEGIERPEGWAPDVPKVQALLEACIRIGYHAAWCTMVT